MLAFVFRSATDWFDRASPAEAARWVLAMVSEAIGRRARQPRGGGLSNWGNDPFSRGSYTSRPVRGDPADLRRLGRAAQSRMPVAGEATRRRAMGFADGALSSRPARGSAPAGVVAGAGTWLRWVHSTHEYRRPARAQAAPALGGPGGGSDRPWLVIVLNDDHNTFDGVAFALARTIPGVTLRARDGVGQPHPPSGKAVVWTGPKERAELYREQLDGFGLTMAPLSSSAG